ncbi:class I SAM-dependent methyltransferase [Flavisolibacter tropicus]|uniref:Methyltransferase type 12 n=1 Tax=Flavisolibacter tropicus TaxID=1492898 RepID=A0A172TSZ2_9BACT|nr:methyltransferase domain-containing protein [Flavisolibacter tropicus]ANE50191.1 hypothetical protein SY85_06425 [Flavisolibacter tropicus]
MSQSATILESWEANATNWIVTIDNQEIESRKLVTNAAIVDAIKKYSPKRIIDIGCGEGWLTRTLQQADIEAEGVDAIEILVNNAIVKGGPHYFIGSYSDIVSGKVLEPYNYDSAVINFALLDKEESEKLIRYLPSILIPQGLLFIQTLHPLVIAETGSYVSGWKEGSWTGLKQPFVLPYQWYFRTLQDWCQLFINAGFKIEEIREPVHPQTLKPLSLLFVLKAL